MTGTRGSFKTKRQMCSTDSKRFVFEHYLIDFITETKSVYCAVYTVYVAMLKDIQKKLRNEYPAWYGSIITFVVIGLYP
jgi:hypothetical protein